METVQTTQLAKKLLVKTAQQWVFLNAPEEVIKSFTELSIKVKTSIVADETFNGVLLFVKNNAKLKADLPAINSVLNPETVFWIAYPKKSSGIVSDLEMTGNWQETEKYGLQVVASAAIDTTWTALRLRPIDQVKKSTVSNSAIQNNQLNQFIDVKNRIVILPDDVKQALEKEPAAFTSYQKLAYSHQKEYLVWILTAKHEKPRKTRITKMLTLLQHKKVS